MSKIYIVIETYHVDYAGDDKRIVAVFTNEDMAKKCAWEDNKSTHYLSYDYEEHELLTA
jgi:hypothetical protein